MKDSSSAMVWRFSRGTLSSYKKGTADACVLPNRSSMNVRFGSSEIQLHQHIMNENGAKERVSAPGERRQLQCVMGLPCLLIEGCISSETLCVNKSHDKQDGRSSKCMVWINSGHRCLFGMAKFFLLLGLTMTG